LRGRSFLNDLDKPEAGVFLDKYSWRGSIVHMGVGIKATNSKNLRVENCSFVGFDTAIELENVDGFVSKNNQFSDGKNPRKLLRDLSEAIAKSRYDKSSKERIGREIISALKSKNVAESTKNKIVSSLKYVGDKAVDAFVQLAAAVAAGMIIR